MMKNELYWIEKKKLDLTSVISWNEEKDWRNAGLRVSTIRKQREMKKQN